MRLKVLVVEDDLINAEILRDIIDGLGYDVEVAHDGAEAVERFRSWLPNLVIMDIKMPVMDGIEATRRIRALGQSHWVPIIYHTSLDMTDEIVSGLNAGADDYLLKPTPPDLIRAKISSYERVLEMQRSVRSQTSELSAWRDMAEQQNRLSQHVVSRLLDAEGLRDSLLEWMNTPADNFSGDLVCAIRGPADMLYLMLADAAGHGLSAALSALPMTQVFYGMAGKGFPIHTIAEELNRKLKCFLPIERFVAAGLAAIDTRNQTIEIWNGGIPDILFLSGDCTIAMRWPSRHPPLGILPPAAFNSSTEQVNYQQAGELFICSDGIIEAENASGARMNQLMVEKLLCSAPPGQRMATLQMALQRHLDGDKNPDDLSCILARVPIERRQDIRPANRPETHGAKDFSDWRLGLTWGLSELRNLDIVPAVLGFMNQIPSLKAHSGNLYLILAELFNNALDHGLLNLDSQLKNEDDGFERYLSEREQRMDALTEGQIDMRFHLHRADGQPALDICITDSGLGFDYEQINLLDDIESGLPEFHGRGIMLVKRLCSELVYTGRGNVVNARYSL